MPYTTKQRETILQKIIDKITSEFFYCREDSDLNDMMRKYGVSLETEPVMPVQKNRSVILVVGALAGKKAAYQMAAKKLGIPERNIEFEDDYAKLTGFDVAKLHYSETYSDIIIGPNPHSMKNKGDGSSVIATIQNNPTEYPKLGFATANNELKITMTNFKDLLKQTRYFQIAA